MEAGEASLEGVLCVSVTCPGRVGASPQQEGPLAVHCLFVWAPTSLREGFPFWSEQLCISRRAGLTGSSPKTPVRRLLCCVSGTPGVFTVKLRLSNSGRWRLCVYTRRAASATGGV